MGFVEQVYLPDHNGCTSTDAPSDASGKSLQPESLDYEVCESEAYLLEQARLTQWDDLIHTTVKWTLCLFTGVLVSLAAFVVNIGVENVAAAKFNYTFWLMNESYFASFFVYCLFNCTLVLLATLLATYVGPAAAGSGIPDVKAFLNGVDARGLLLARTLVAKSVGCVCSVAAGLAVGKEGPFVHIGCCIASLLGQGGTKRFHFRSRWLETVKNDKDHRELVTCGATAGVAAAFRSPVGGVLFALEEASSWWSNHLLWRAFWTTAVVSVVVRTTMKWCGGKSCGYFGSGGYIIFEMREGQVDYELYELFPMAMLGVVGGLLGASFNSLSARLAMWRCGMLEGQPKSARVLEALLITLITSTVTYLVPFTSPCRYCPTDRQRNVDYGNYVSFNCPEAGQYNPLATLFFNTQDNAIRSLFNSNTDHEYDIASLTTFFLFFYGLAIITYGINVPSGLFVPGILIGASYGRLVGYMMTEYHGGKDIDEGTYALLGAASFLGGCMRITVSLCVILLELTNNLNLLPLMMLVLLVAKAVGDWTGVKAVYDMQIDLKALPVMGDDPEPFMRHITAADAAAGPATTFMRIEKVGLLMEVLMSCPHNSFPVMETDPATGRLAFLGLVLRSHLLQVLRSRRAFQASPKPTSPAPERMTPAQTWKPASTRGITVQDIVLDAADMELYLDLAPYLNPSPYTVQADTSLNKVYTLFRTLGLRHLVVVPKASEVVGIITRKDLLPENLEARFPGVSTAHQTDIRDSRGRMKGHWASSDNLSRFDSPEPLETPGHRRLSLEGEDEWLL